ncbi:hypothetical protein FOMG_16189 [Fusarium oxysporum f. sp. melonis 26406]|uniref:Uncharacterized protein n=1 Tax=Fusarium oxysporum f. sp. melonis 26406 TaxID=1089452 RepID=X0A289_FUSOX|nr:hypothetical protein FOMG_16189 [Fusarium oxysporum f. sp. melonis 26406]
MERVKPLAPKLMINIHPEWVKKLRDDWNICCSFGFKSDSSKEEFNIIAWARTPQKNYNVSFEDIYEIGAYADNVKLGDEIVPNTELVRVKLGDTVSLSKGWTISIVEPPEDVAPDGFRFRTKSDGDASAVVMKYIHQEMQPVYIAGLGTGPLPSGTYTIKPTGNVCFFFLGQQEKTAFSLNKVSNPKIIQYAGKLPLTVSYDREGNWIVGNDIDLDPGSH